MISTMGQDIIQLGSALIGTLVFWFLGYSNQKHMFKWSRIIHVPPIIALICGKPRQDSTIDLKYGSLQIVCFLVAVVFVITLCLGVDFQVRAQIYIFGYTGGLILWTIFITLDHLLMRGRKGYDPHL